MISAKKWETAHQLSSRQVVSVKGTVAGRSSRLSCTRCIYLFCSSYRLNAIRCPTTTPSATCLLSSIRLQFRRFHLGATICGFASARPKVEHDAPRCVLKCCRDPLTHLPSPLLSPLSHASTSTTTMSAPMPSPLQRYFLRSAKMLQNSLGRSTSCLLAVLVCPC